MPWFPTVPSAEASAKKPAWLNDPLRYHDRGDIDFSNCSQRCYEQGDFFGLDDLFTEQPVVMKGLAAIYGGWIRRFKVDGFRVDTARHVNAAFFRLWVPRILASAKAAGVGGFQIFGEVPLTDDVELSAYVRDRGLPNVLDFPFQQDAVGYAGGVSSPRAVATRLADDDYFLGPSGVAATPATFLGNHDMGRAALQVANASHASGQELVDRLLLGYGLMYLLRGAPVVLYGDEVGMIGRGGDQQARQDMFPTQVDEWKTQERAGSPPIGNGSSFDVRATRSRPGCGSWGRFATRTRRSRPAPRSSGSRAERARRQPDRPGGAARAARRLQLRWLVGPVTVKTATPSSAWTPLFGTSSGATSDAAGSLTLTVPALGAVLLRADAQIPAGACTAGAEGRPRRLQLALARGRDRRRAAGQRRLRRPPRGRRLAAARGRRLAAVSGVPRARALPAQRARPARRGRALARRPRRRFEGPAVPACVRGAGR